MEIHELNTFSGTLGSGDYFATDNGTDTSKVSAEAMFAPLNARIDNIIASPAPSAEEVVDARLGAEALGSKTYQSLGAAIRGQVTDLSDDLSDLKSDIDDITFPYINLFNPIYLQTRAKWKRNGDEYYGVINDLFGAFKRNDAYYPFPAFEENTQYTLSFDSKMSGNTSGNGIEVQIWYTDNEASYLRVPNSQTTYNHYSITSTANKTIAKICLSYGSQGSNIGYLKNIQFEKGSSETDFVHYLVANDIKARADIVALSTAHSILATDFESVNNLSAITKYTKGYVSSNGIITFNDNWDYTHEWTSDFIKINPNTKYTLFNGGTVPASIIADGELYASASFYDSNKSFIRRNEYNNDAQVGVFGTFRNAFWTPATAEYMRVSARHYEDGFVMVYEGTANYPYAFSSYDVQNAIQLIQRVNGIGDLVSDDVLAICLGNNIKSINHTGWHEAPENTLPAYKASKQKGFRYVETDVSFTSDNVPVLLHDNSINRTARNADGTEISGTVNIYDITYEQALDYDFGIYKGDEYAGTKIPTLEQFVLLCRNLGLHPYIEIKSSYDYTRQQVEECVNIVKRYGMKDKVTWISFSSTYLNYIKAVDPNARLGFVVSSIDSSAITNAQNLKNSTNEVFIDSGSYTDAEVNLCISADIPMEVWTIGTTELINSINPYVSGFTSDSLNASMVLYESNIN